MMTGLAPMKEEETILLDGEAGLLDFEVGVFVILEGQEGNNIRTLKVRVVHINMGIRCLGYDGGWEEVNGRG